MNADDLLTAVAEIERLKRVIHDLDVSTSDEIERLTAKVERLRAALDEIVHYWSGPIDPGWKEIARRALEES